MYNFMAESNYGATGRSVEMAADLGRHVAYAIFKTNVEGMETLKSATQVSSLPLSVAVVGPDSGIGKSSLINAQLGYTSDEIGAAPVGGTTTVFDIKSYQNRSRPPKLTMWDIPGLGTGRFQKENFMREIEYERFDLFLVVSATRFTENDTWLVREIRNRGKDVFFVRTKIDADVSNDKQARPKTHDENRVIDSIRRTTVAGLQASGFPESDVTVFLVDSYETSKFDFRQLQERLLNHNAVFKSRSFAFSFVHCSNEIQEQRIRDMHHNEWKICALFALFSLIPIFSIFFCLKLLPMLNMYTRFALFSLIPIFSIIFCLKWLPKLMGNKLKICALVALFSLIPIISIIFFFKLFSKVMGNELNICARLALFSLIPIFSIIVFRKWLRKVMGNELKICARFALFAVIQIFSIIVYLKYLNEVIQKRESEMCLDEKSLQQSAASVSSSSVDLHNIVRGFLPPPSAARMGLISRGIPLLSVSLILFIVMCAYPNNRGGFAAGCVASCVVVFGVSFFGTRYILRDHLRRAKNASVAVIDYLSERLFMLSRQHNLSF